jgi:hypothetical protein
MPNVNDLKKSKFLTQKDVQKPILVTIVGYDEINVAKEGAEEELRWALLFKEIDKPFILNSTNGQIIESIIGSGDFDNWKNKKIVLYHDPNVSFGGKLVGGIRVRAAKNQAVQPADPEPEPEPTEDDIPF